VNKKRIWILIGALVLILVSVLLLKSKPEEGRRGGKRDKQQLAVDALVVHPESLQSELAVTGSLLANDEVELKNDIAGRIVYLNLPEGKSVRKGTLLVRLFNDDLQAGLKRLEAELSLQEQLSKRQSELQKINGISQNEYDKTVLQVGTLKAEIEQQRALLRKTEVLAPFDGVIGLRNVSVGAVVNTSTTLATLRSSSLKLDFFVPEKYIETIKTGMKVSFTLYSGKKTYQATVLATERGIDDNTRSLKVRALLTESGSELNPGAFAKVNLSIGENQQAIMIPSEALIPMERNQQVVVARKGKAVFVDVRTGIRKESKVEIVEGLKTGDTLVTSGLMFLKPHDSLKFSRVINPS
jgi:membrane fusion protein, multidrug efflux system